MYKNNINGFFSFTLFSTVYSFLYFVWTRTADCCVLEKIKFLNSFQKRFFFLFVFSFHFLLFYPVLLLIYLNDIKSSGLEIGGRQMCPIVWNDVIVCAGVKNDLYWSYYIYIQSDSPSILISSFFYNYAFIKILSIVVFKYRYLRVILLNI